MTRFLKAQFIYDPERKAPIRNGYVAVEEDGTVVKCGDASELSSDIECENYCGALIPGMVDSHNHIELSHMHHRMPKGTGMAKFVDIITEVRDYVPIERKKELVSQWMDELYRQGVSAMADISNDDFSFEIKSRHPLYTRTFLEVFSADPDACPQIMEDVKKLQKTARDLGLDAAPTPHACYSMSPRLLTEVSVEGLKDGFLSFHCEESEQEELLMMEGRGPLKESREKQGLQLPPSKAGRSALDYFIERLDEGKVLPVEGNMLLVHEVCMTEKGAKAAAAAFKHPYVAICPLSNIYIHNQLPPVNEMRKWPVTITVGTDSLSSNDTLNMMKELFCLQENFDVPMQELVTWTCLNGARFLGKDDVLGSFAPGKKPGVVLIQNLSEDGRLTVASVSKRLV